MSLARDRFKKGCKAMIENPIDVYRAVRERIQQYKLAHAWRKSGKAGAPPPHIIKEQIIREYAKRFSTPVLIETGTYFGDTVYAMRKRFRRIISIELDEALYRRAKTRFKNFAHVAILHGDSAELLPTILREEKARCLFWLDGHYSGGLTAKGQYETPVLEELKHIKSAGDDHIILIDDARLFQGKNDYPTIESLESFVRSQWPRNIFAVSDDIIRIHPPFDESSGGV